MCPREVGRCPRLARFTGGTETGKATHNGCYQTQDACKLLILLEANTSDCCVYETLGNAKGIERFSGVFHR
jgi:hypothetical protein